MSDKPFDREAWNTRERPYSTDNNYEASYADLALREILVNLLNTRISVSNDASNTTPPTSFFGEAFKVRPGGALAVNVTKGIGLFGDPTNLPTAIGGLVGVNDLSAYKPLVLTELEAIAVPANASGNPRIDIIEVRYRQELTDATNRDIMTPTPPYVFSPGLVSKTLTWALNGQQGTVVTPAPSTAYISYVRGIPAGSPVAPSVTSGYVKICEIAVANGAATINAADITDYRRIFAPYGMQRAALEITGVPLSATYSITKLNAPPGVEATLFTLGGGSATQFAVGVQIKCGLTPNYAFALAPTLVDSVAGMVVSYSTDVVITAGTIEFAIRGQILNSTGPTFGVDSFTPPVLAKVSLEWGY